MTSRHIKFDIRTPTPKMGEKHHNIDDLVDQRLAKLKPMFPNIKVMRRERSESVYDFEAKCETTVTTFHVDLGEEHHINEILQ